MAYGTEAFIHVETSLSSPDVEAFNSEGSIAALRLNSDLWEEVRDEEVRDEAQVDVICYQDKVSGYFNKKVKTRNF